MYIRIFIVLFICLSPFNAFALSISTDSSSSDSGIFSVLEKVNKEKTTLSEKESHIKYEEENIKENISRIEQIEKLQSQLKDIETSINTVKKFYTGTLDILQNQDYQEKTKLFETTLWELLWILSFPSEAESMSFTWYLIKKYEVTKQIATKLKEINKDISDSESTIQKSQDELKLLYEEVRKSETTFQTEVQDLVTKVAIFIAALITLLFLGNFLKKVIKKSGSLSDEKKEIFLLIVRWVKNIIIIIIIFAFFFSEFVSILPFLAILWTALWLALRDLISSFIAWFVIGLKDGIYKLNDVIEIDADKIFWKVVKITPLVTIVQELGMNGPNGASLSYPNKRIFETPVKNHSKMNNWIYISVDFFFDVTTDIALTKEKLKEAMWEVISLEKFRSPLSQKSFLKKFGYNETVLHPQIFLESKPQWIMIRWKILVSWWERHEIKGLIIEEFLTRIHWQESIKILSTWGEKI